MVNLIYWFNIKLSFFSESRFSGPDAWQSSQWVYYGTFGKEENCNDW